MFKYSSFAVIVVFLFANSLLSAQGNMQEERPNFIVIFADDLGYGDVGSAGSELIQTPHIDRMEDEGVRLTNFYSTANVCTPARAGLLTGRYPIRTGLADGVLFPGDEHGLPHDEVTIAGTLKETGYRTAMFGKWHLGTVDVSWPTQHGFDYYYGLPYSNDMLPLALYRNSEAIEEPVDQATLTKRYTQEAIRFMEEHREDSFFIYLPHTMPHTPLYASEDFTGRSKAGLYGDVIEEIDWSVGAILNALKRLGLDDNTMVILTSDNGPWFEGSSGELRERKGGASWDGGYKVPFIARWPGHIPPGATSDAISMNFDMFPTLLDLAGAEIPTDREIDGKNIWSLLQGSNQSPHEYLYLFNNEEITAVRSQRWKFVVRSYYRTGLARFYGERQGGPHYYHPGLLFDLELNPEEQFSYTREQPEIVEKMVERLEKGRAELEVLGNQ
jgi:arylsulfatase A